MDTHRPARTGARLVMVAVAATVCYTVIASPAGATPGRLDPALGERFAQAATTEFWVELQADADLGAIEQVDDPDERAADVVDELVMTAQESQTGVIDVIDDAGAPHEAFWITNVVKVVGTAELAAELAARPDVAAVTVAPEITIPQPTAGPGTQAAGWNIEAVGAPRVWSELGVRGEGIVVANIDGGAQWDHPALINSYRGNVDGAIDHGYSWFDGYGACAVPDATCVDDHGTHTVGTMVGDDGAGNAIGVAPGARWIAARACRGRSCDSGALIAAAQWMLAPTDLDGANPRPELRPDVVSNSWGTHSGWAAFNDIVDAWVAAGIFPVFSIGNDGPRCERTSAPGSYANAYAVGATDSAGLVADFSSRGPGPFGDGKPDIAAPGQSVRSAATGSRYASFSGTSMAAPHVAGAVALIWSRSPVVRGNVAATKVLLDDAAVDVDDTRCGGTLERNNAAGEGRLDAYAAAVPAPPGPVGRLEGWLIDEETSARVPGVSVQVMSSGYLQHVTTGADGAFGFNVFPGRARLIASAFGYEPRTVDFTVGEGETVVAVPVLTTRARFMISGRIMEGSHASVGATVTVADTPISAVTDAHGRYWIHGVPTGSYQLVVRPVGGCFAPEGRPLTVDGDEVLDLTLAQLRDLFGYRCDVVPAQYVEASDPLALLGDDAVATVALPFAFPFYGATYGEVHVSTNGHVSFADRSVEGANTFIPSSGVPNAAIYAFWDDLSVAPATAYTQVLGQAPDRRFVIEWRDVRIESSGQRIDVEAILHERGRVLIQYRGLGADRIPVRGARATIGIESADGLDGLLYSYNAPSLVDSTAIVFSAGRPPGAPIIGAATGGDGAATVAFAPPDSDGGATITAYTVSASPGGMIATGPASPITVTGLTNGTPYTFTVRATNADGVGPTSAPSNAVTPSGDALAVADVVVDESADAAAFTVTRTGTLMGAATVQYATADGTAVATNDYTATAGDLTLPTGTTTATVTVPIVGDESVEGDESFEVRLSSATGATIGRGTGMATIVDDDTTLSIDDVSVVEGHRGRTLATFGITRTGVTTVASSVLWASGDGTATAPSDYVPVAPTMLTFQPGQTVATVTVRVRGDRRVEPDETFTVELSSPVGTTLTDGSATGTIVSDDGTELGGGSRGR